MSERESGFAPMLHLPTNCYRRPRAKNGRRARCENDVASELSSARGFLVNYVDVATWNFSLFIGFLGFCGISVFMILRNCGGFFACLLCVEE